MKREVRVPALQIRQGTKRHFYTFAVDGKLVPEFAAASRVRRDASGLWGYQRAEQLAHVQQIRNYLESEAPLLPNAVVIAFDKRVKFVEFAEAPRGDHSRVGELVIPIDDELEEHERPGFIVDGQQRIAAIREAQIKSFPICVTAFIASSIREQTEQFILVNATKPLPKGLIYELLPATDALLPLQLERRRLPAILVTKLNEDPTSPLYQVVRTATNPDGRIKDNSLLKVIEQSLSDGVLHRFRPSDNEEPDVEAMTKVLKSFFSAVKEVFPEEWELPPKRSRLTHGVGIAGLGCLMERIAERAGKKALSAKLFREDLEVMRTVCHWTDGSWDFGSGQKRRWDELQNTSKDVELLVKFLGAAYKRRFGGSAGSAPRLN